MNLQDEPFFAIDNGTKKIEMRLYDEKRQKINIGDIIVFNNDHTDKIVNVKVVKLYLFKDFNDLYNYFNKTLLGYKINDIADSFDMTQYYKKEDIDKYGVIGIEIEKINEKIQ